MGKIFKFEYVHVVKYVLDLLNFQCLAKKKRGGKKRKGREKRRAQKIISALPLTVFFKSPSVFRLQIIQGYFNRHGPQPLFQFALFILKYSLLSIGWKLRRLEIMLIFNSLVTCALLNSNNSWIEANNAGFRISVLIQ